MNKVTVLCPTGHRVTVTIPRHSLLAEVKTEACNKRGLDPSSHALFHQGRKLDLSLSLHLENLGQNCLLEMAVEDKIPATGESKVDICIQLESGQRITGIFSSATTLQEIYDYAKSGSQSTVDDDCLPVIVYLRKEIIGPEEFSKNTLQMLGLQKGRAILRLLHRHSKSFNHQAYTFVPTELPKVQPEIEEKVNWRPMKKEDNCLSTILTRKEEESVIPEVDREPEVMKVEDETSEMEVDESHMEIEVLESKTSSAFSRELSQSPTQKSTFSIEDKHEDPVVHVLEGGGVLFVRQAGRSQLAEPDDDFFELTVEDAKIIQADLRRQAGHLTSGGVMMTEQMRMTIREGEKLMMLKKYPRTVIRVQFPDNHILQGVFLSGQDVGDVESFVRRYLKNPEMSFSLVIPPRTKISPTSSLLDSNCVPSVLLRFVTENSFLKVDSIFKEDVLDKVSNYKGATKALEDSGVVKLQDEKREKTKAAINFDSPSQPPKTARIPEQTNQPQTSSTKAVPKWFKNPSAK